MKLGEMGRRAAGAGGLAWWGAAAVAVPIVLTLGGCEERRASGQEALDETAPRDHTAPPQEAIADTTLQRMAAELQPELERRSGLEAKFRPRVALSDSATLLRYLHEQLDEQLPPEKALAITAAYARLGLVPDTMDLRAALIALLEEQVVGYYDARADTLFVRTHVDEKQLETVLVHELVHALQDQHFDLDSLMRAVSDDGDRSTAAEAAVEGHATLTMMEWQLAQMTGSDADVTALPDLGEQLRGIDLAALGDGSLPALQTAPRVIREALIFPYIGGLGFTQRLWKERPGRPVPLGESIPMSTEQVLHWEAYADQPPDLPVAVDFTVSEPDAWEQIHTDNLGELGIRIFLAEHLGGEDLAMVAARGWGGDRFRLLRADGNEAFVWVIAWDDDASAATFARAAEGAYAARYSEDGADRRVTVERADADGKPVVRILDMPAGVELPADWLPARFRLTVP